MVIGEGWHAKGNGLIIRHNVVWIIIQIFICSNKYLFKINRK